MDVRHTASILKLIYCIVVTIAFLISLLSFKRNYARHLKLFSILLGITCVVEWLATHVVRRYWNWSTNSGLYNSFMLLEFMAYAWYYYCIVKLKKVRAAIRIFMYLFPIFWVLTVVLFFGINKWNSYVVVVGAVLAVSLSLAYFYQLLRQATDIHLATHPEFWIAAGMLMLYMAQIPYFGMLNYVYANYKIAAGYFSLVMLVLNIFMYLSFIFAFLCPKTIPAKR